jgi:hypothetical protein
VIRNKDEVDNAETIRPIKSPTQSPHLPSANSFSVDARSEPMTTSLNVKLAHDAKEDFSDDLEVDDKSFSQKVSRMRVCHSRTFDTRDAWLNSNPWFPANQWHVQW